MNTTATPPELPRAETPAPPPAAGRAAPTSHGLLRRIPASARTAALIGLCVMVAMLAYTAWSAGESTLQLVCRHNFRDADISVRVDGDVAFSEHLSGAERKRFGVFGGVEGNFSRALSLAAGEHLVEVHVKSAEGGFDQTRSSRVNLPSGEASTLQVSASRSSLNLSYQGPPVETSGWSRLSNNAVSLLVTLGGSIASAGIGFFVQEFLKNKKTA